MKRALILLALFCAALSAQVPTCNLTLSTTGASATSWYNNQGTLCRSFTVTYQASGFSALSFELDGAPCGATCSTQGTAVAIGAPLQGSNPSTDTGEATIVTNLYYPWIRLNLSSATGTGTFSSTAMGYPGLSARTQTINTGRFNSAGVYLPNAVFTGASVANAGTGDIDLYTCPSGKRCFFQGISAYNTTASSVTWFAEVKISGVYYRICNNRTLANTTTATNNFAPVFVLEPGESAAINTTGSGLNVGAELLNYDNSAAYYSPKKAGAFLAADNTFYIVPTGKTATINSFQYSNSTGGTTNVQPKYSNQGATAIAIDNVSAVLSGVQKGYLWIPKLVGGDSMILNTDQVGNQLVFITVSEY